MNSKELDRSTARSRALATTKIGPGPVVYLPTRDFRVVDNWALAHAYLLALKHQRSILVVFFLAPKFGKGGQRQYQFLLSGVQEMAADLNQVGIPLELVSGEVKSDLAPYLRRLKPALLVTDFSPLREVRGWQQELISTFDCSIIEVDAHNLVPAWHLSDKEEFSARFLRPKIWKKLPDWPLLPEVKIKQVKPWAGSVKSINWKEASQFRQGLAETVSSDWCLPGEKQAQAALKSFIKYRLPTYAEGRNNPNTRAQSDLSPYIRFGHLSVARIKAVVDKSAVASETKEAFLEELVVRRELAENFCFYQPNYDNFDGLRDWAKTTLNKHTKDKRDYIYSYREFQGAKTHDPLWNAAQKEMLWRGKMHGYLRMYWAKKILEWTNTPREAIEVAIKLNDQYELDGRDPSGYAGVLWSIGGLHDRPWFERPVFGQIRYMNAAGSARKFSVESYIEYVDRLTGVNNF